MLRRSLSINFISGYLIEESLSIDNLFVMMAILRAFSVRKSEYKHVLFWGILGAVVLRFIFIFAGAALISRFEWLLYLFGAYLLYAGVKMYLERKKEAQIQRPDGHHRALGLSPAQLEGLRTALIAVVERGTAAASRSLDLELAGKTGTAQNSHGEDHGWYVGFAPAHKPTIIVGSIMEFAEHGSNVAPYVNKVLARYVLGKDFSDTPLSVALPADSAPRAVQIIPDSVRLVDPVADDTVLPPPPAPSEP